MGNVLGEIDQFSASLTDAAAWQSNTAKRWRLDSAYAVFDGHLHQVAAATLIPRIDFSGSGRVVLTEIAVESVYPPTTVQHSIIVTAVYIGGKPLKNIEIDLLLLKDYESVAPTASLGSAQRGMVVTVMHEAGGRIVGASCGPGSAVLDSDELQTIEIVHPGFTDDLDGERRFELLNEIVNKRTVDAVDFPQNT